MEIRNRFTDLIICSGDDLKTLVEENKDKLQGANLQEANLRGADLRGADLQYAYLQEADLRGADLQEADLQEADLRGADLQEADLQEADLQEANLRGADLRWADLQGAYLQYANLQGADLQGANLRWANTNETKGLEQTEILPRKGEVFGWKKCVGGVLVELRVLPEAKRSNASTRKCRAEKVEVIDVVGSDVGLSYYDGETTYKKGEIVECHAWCEDRWQECGGGIHFFLTIEEAEAF